MNLLKQIQIEYEHFPNIEAKNSYKQNVAVISQKLRQCEANLLVISLKTVYLKMQIHYLIISLFNTQFYFKINMFRRSWI
jgi:Mg-chelatase subunit ChlD